MKLSDSFCFMFILYCCVYNYLCCCFNTLFSNGFSVMHATFSVSPHKKNSHTHANLHLYGNYNYLFFTIKSSTSFIDPHHSSRIIPFGGSVIVLRSPSSFPSDIPSPGFSVSIFTFWALTPVSFSRFALICFEVFETL